MAPVEMKPALVGLVTLAVVALVLVGFLGASSTSGFANYGKTNARGTFTMYYADWCPHCQTAKPLFKKFMEGGKKNINGHLVKLQMIEEKQIQKGKDPEVKGYPTFMYTDAAGKIVEFSGPRTADGFLKFLETQVLS